MLLAALVLAGCSHSSSSGVDYINPQCPVSFSMGCPGACPVEADSDTCPCDPQTLPFTCEPVPKECSDNQTCGCIGCTETTCGGCSSGAGASCYYDAGTFVVQCINQ